MSAGFSYFYRHPRIWNEERGVEEKRGQVGRERREMKGREKVSG